MPAWDISPSGVEFVVSLVRDAMDDMAKDVESYGRNVESAAASAGTIAGTDSGAAPTGAIAAALALFVERTAPDVMFLGARAAKSVNAAREAAAYYVLGDLDMAATSQHRSLSAPKVDLPGAGDSQDGGG
ncbi:DUF6507 family protein [Streptomyces sp. HSG2]|uniref:DUF6507 family protein n=1 Tax=Streptomyces sp. HSG2 TaxID=2797167 RepID=UPI001907A234|nr:DUF6507 family protein [Streptomyces sp. HSG2]